MSAQAPSTTFAFSTTKYRYDATTGYIVVTVASGRLTWNLNLKNVEQIVRNGSVLVDLTSKFPEAFLNTINGTASKDVLIGTVGADAMNGLAGNDVIKGLAGKDTLDGGAGSDTADYTDKTTAVSVTLNGAVAANVSVGGVVEDTVKNIENIWGGSADDVLTGDALTNTLKGGAGSDTLDGGAGNDTADYTDKTTAVSVILNGAVAANVSVGGVVEDTVKNIENILGGSANDVLTGDAMINTLRGGAGKDTLDGGAGSDTADYTDKSAAVSVTLNGAVVANVSVGGVVEDTVKNIENLMGGKAGDTLTGDGVANRFKGGAGNDVLDGGAGSDTADYTDKTTAVSVTLNGAVAANVSVGGVVEDTVKNIENIWGGSADDVLTGDALDNLLNGGAGNDLLNGGLGNDTLIGGAGLDKFVFNTSPNGVNNLDTITDFVSASDKIQFSKTVFSTLSSATPTADGVALNPTDFISGATVSASFNAGGSNYHLMYNSVSGALFYDADGAGSADAIQVALLGTSSHPVLLSTDIGVIL